MRKKRIYKSVAVLLLICVLLQSGLCGALAAQEDNLPALDAEVMTMDVAAFIENGRTYTPARFIAETFGIYVTWKGATKTVILSRGLTVATMQIGSKELVCLIAGETSVIQMDVAPILHDGRTMLPARYLAEAFGLKVEWFEKTNTVTVAEGEKVLSLVIGQKELTLTGGHFLKAYDGSENFRFFYPVGYEKGNDTENSAEIEMQIGEMALTVLVLYIPGEDVTPPMTTIEDITDTLSKSGENLTVEPLTLLGYQAYKISGTFNEETQAGVVFVKDGHLGIFGITVDEEGPDSLIAANKLLDELLPSFTLATDGKPFHTSADSADNNPIDTTADIADDVLFDATDYTADSLKFLDCDGNILLTAADFTKAQAGYNSSPIAQSYIELTIKDPMKFAAVTKTIAANPEGKNYIAIVLNDELLSQPFVPASFADEGITSESVIVQGEALTLDVCQKLAKIFDHCIALANER